MLGRRPSVGIKASLGTQPGRGQYEDRPELWIGFELPEQRFTYVRDGEEIEGARAIGRRFRAPINPNPI